MRLTIEHDPGNDDDLLNAVYEKKVNMFDIRSVRSSIERAMILFNYFGVRCKDQYLLDTISWAGAVCSLNIDRAVIVVIMIMLFVNAMKWIGLSAFWWRWNAQQGLLFKPKLYPFDLVYVVRSAAFSLV